MRWLKSRGKTAAVLGLGALAVTGLGLGLADSAQAAGSHNHNIMIRTGSGIGGRSVGLEGWTRGSLSDSKCTKVQNGIYNNTGFLATEDTQLVVFVFADANCQHELKKVTTDVPRNISTRNWWYTIGG